MSTIADLIGPAVQAALAEALANMGLPAGSMATLPAPVAVEAQPDAALAAAYQRYVKAVTHGKPRTLAEWAAWKGHTAATVAAPAPAPAGKPSKAGKGKTPPVATFQIAGHEVKAWRQVNARDEDRGNLSMPGPALPHVLAALEAGGITLVVG